MQQLLQTLCGIVWELVYRRYHTRKVVVAVNGVRRDISRLITLSKVIKDLIMIATIINANS